MEPGTIVFIVVAATVGIVLLLARKGRAAKAHEAKREEVFRETQQLLKQLNTSLGYPEGQGPTGVMLNGEYHVVNVGHTERLKTDPAYAFGNKMTDFITDLQNLESALKEAEAQGNETLANKIRAELISVRTRADAYMDEYQRTKSQT